MKSIFLDTNIFLHFTSFDEIQWLKESDSSECEIIISPFVIDELDKKKVGTSKVSNRARTALQKIEKFIETNELKVQKGVQINILNHKPTKDFYKQYELNYDEPDQRILASIIDYRLKNPSNTTILCSDDIGPRLRAKNFQIESLKLTDSYRLASEESENEKKIKKLENENLLLKTKIPKLKLEFESGHEYKKIKVKESGLVTREQFIHTGLLQIREELPHIENPSKKVSNGNTLSAISLQLSALSQEQVDQYNKDLDKYFEEFELHLGSLYEFEHQQELSYLIEVSILNEGTVPGEEIDVHLHFPDGFDLMEPRNLIKRPTKPEPPYRPTHRMDFRSHLINSAFLFPRTQFTPPSNIDFNRPSIKKTNSYDVNMYRKYIKHSYSVKLDDLVMVYNERSQIANYQIDYEITAANMPQRVQGKLNVIFEK